MELKLDEQKLLANFRHLSAEGKRELLDYAAFMVKKHPAQIPEETATGENQCPIQKEEERPEAAKEPIFTE